MLVFILISDSAHFRARRLQQRDAGGGRTFVKCSPSIAVINTVTIDIGLGPSLSGSVCHITLKKERLLDYVNIHCQIHLILGFRLKLAGKEKSFY